MDVSLGMHLYTSDDKDLGTIERVILDPESRSVKSVVVSKGFFLPRDIEVPTEVLTADESGDAHVPYTSEQADQLPAFIPEDYTTPPADFLVNSQYPPAAIYWPAGYGAGMLPLGTESIPFPTTLTGSGDTAVDREVEAALRQQDMENAVIGPGSDVLDHDGEKVGTVRELTFDAESGLLTDVVVHRGLIFGKETTLPATAIESVDNGVVYLKLQAKEVGV